MALTNPDLFDFIRIILFLVAEGGIGSYRIMWSGGSESILINYECCCPTKAMIEIRHVDKNVEPLKSIDNPTPFFKFHVISHRYQASIMGSSTSVSSFTTSA